MMCHVVPGFAGLSEGQVAYKEAPVNLSPVIAAAVSFLASCAHHQLCSGICLVHCSHAKRPCGPAVDLPCEAP